jgi:hypothetical protein
MLVFFFYVGILSLLRKFNDGAFFYVGPRTPAVMKKRTRIRTLAQL